MKLCILSMQHVPNFGSALQSYALKGILESLGHAVAFLDIAPNEEDNRLLGGAFMRICGEGEISGSLAAKLKKLDRYTWNRIRQKRLWKKQGQKFQEFRAQQLPTADRNSRYDCCVIGSDEVFSCLSRTPWGFTSQLFGNVHQADRVITYAASCGSTVFQAVPQPAADRIQEAFGNVAAISVRDENTREFASHFTDLTIEEHFDPALAANFDREMVEAGLPENLPERYCLVYSYYNRICDQESIRQIKKFCREQNLQLLTLGAPQKWIPNHLVMMPFEALNVFRNAAFVITDTFHGTIFSAKYSERFAVMIRSSNRNKLGDLVRKLQLEKHVVESFDKLEKVFRTPNDRDRIAALTERERERSVRYLHENLTGV